MSESRDRLVVYRDVVKGPREWYLWRQHGLSAELCTWWAAFRAGWLLDYGIHQRMLGRSIETPAHLLLGDGCDAGVQMGLLSAARESLVDAFVCDLRQSEAPVAMALLDLPLRARLLVALGRSLPPFTDTLLWPAWVAAVPRWRSFWDLRTAALPAVVSGAQPLALGLSAGIQ